MSEHPEALAEPRTIVYLDEKPLTRECTARWLAAKIADHHILAAASVDDAPWPDKEDRVLSLVLLNSGARDLSAPEMIKQFELLRAKMPDVPIAVVTDNEDHEVIGAALVCGLQGVIPTSMAGAAVIEVIRLICAGGTYAPAASIIAWCAAAARERQGGKVSPLPFDPSPGVGEPRPVGVLDDKALVPAKSSFFTEDGSAAGPSIGIVAMSPGPQLPQGFTPRQTEILHCLKRGLANKVIAYELQMCESTVKIHVRNIMKKLRVTNRTQVVSKIWQISDASRSASN